jgi:hypothetical protein
VDAQIRIERDDRVLRAREQRERRGPRGLAREQVRAEVEEARVLDRNLRGVRRREQELRAAAGRQEARAPLRVERDERQAGANRPGNVRADRE